MIKKQNALHWGPLGDLLNYEYALNGLLVFVFLFNGIAGLFETYLNVKKCIIDKEKRREGMDLRMVRRTLN